MNKTELVAHVASETGLTKADAERAVAAVVGGVTSSLAGGTDVSLAGFGKFVVKERAARKGRNPQTGEEIQIAASKAVSFKAASGLKDAVQ